MLPLFSRRAVLSLCHFALVTHLKPGWVWNFSHLGTVANEQSQIHSSCLSLALAGEGVRAKSCLPSVFFNLLFLLRVGFALRPSHKGDLVLVESEGSSLAVAPFAHFHTCKNKQNYYMQTFLFTTWSCVKTTVFHLNRFLDFNYIYIRSAVSVCCSFSSTHLPLHLYFLKILEFGYFFCCPAVVKFVQMGLELTEVGHRRKLKCNLSKCYKTNETKLIKQNFHLLMAEEDLLHSHILWEGVSNYVHVYFSNMCL